MSKDDNTKKIALGAKGVIKGAKLYNSTPSMGIASHINLPPGSMAVGEGLGHVSKAVSKVAIPLTVAVDVAQTGVSVYKDKKNGTTRNTVETVTTVAGGWAGGYGGALGGAAIGTLIFPGVGTIVGGLIGAISGGIGGSFGAGRAVKKIGDACNYDMVEKRCKECGKLFKVRQYHGQKDIEYCPDCLKCLS